MFKLVSMIAAAAVIAGCSSPDSVPSVQSMTASASTDLCADLKTAADADALTRDPNARSWDQQRTVVLEAEPATISAFDHAVADAGGTTVAGDLTTVRDFAVETYGAVRSSVTFDDFSARIAASDSSAATDAGDRVNAYSIATCGFPLIVDGS